MPTRAARFSMVYRSIGGPNMLKTVCRVALMLPLMTAAAQAAPDAQAALEAKLDSGIRAEDQVEWLKRMTAQPNHVGSAHDKANAEASLALFKSWGWDARIEQFDVLYPTPISTTVELVGPETIELGGQEPAVVGDLTSGNTGAALPPYVAFQGDGDVTGDLVYANYGMPADYEALARRGIDVRGKIVLTRYGGGWRGLKPLLAQQHGAIGCIIYSDPNEDGFRNSDAYPKGGARPDSGVQRGSVLDMPLYPGDPLTPGQGSTPGTKRLSREEAVTLLKIPALPMSWGDALKLLERLGGPVAPPSMSGALPLTYHLGGNGGVKVHLAVKSEWKARPVYDVIAMLKGSKYPDEWVVRGNHHDGWVFGASDPLTGNVAMLSEAKALGAMVKAGWRPKRTIVYASWDGEEPGLLGSTEWGEAHAAELKQKAVLYINTDSNGRGFFGAGGSPAWQHMVNGAVRDVTDPQTGLTVAQRAAASVRTDAYDRIGRTDEAELAAAESGGDLPISPLGSGSDYTVFVAHLGIPSLNVGFGGEDESSGTYHSIYDSFDHVMRFDDPGLKYGAALSKAVGRMVLRTSEADSLPVRYADVAASFGRWLADLKKLASDQRARDQKLEVLLNDRGFAASSDPLKPVGAPVAKTLTPFMDFSALDNAMDRLKASATSYDKAYAAKGAALTLAARQKLNGLLQDIDQLLTAERGLPGRPWFKNVAYAPGRLTGYGAKTFPGVREGIEDRRFDDAATYAKLTADAIDAYAKRLDTARAILEGTAS